MSGVEAVPQSNAESEADGEEESTRKNAGRLGDVKAKAKAKASPNSNKVT